MPPQLAALAVSVHLKQQMKNYLSSNCFYIIY